MNQSLPNHIQDRITALSDEIKTVLQATDWTSKVSVIAVEHGLNPDQSRMVSHHVMKILTGLEKKSDLHQWLVQKIQVDPDNADALMHDISVKIFDHISKLFKHSKGQVGTKPETTEPSMQHGSQDSIPATPAPAIPNTQPTKQSVQATRTPGHDPYHEPIEEEDLDFMPKPPVAEAGQSKQPEHDPSQKMSIPEYKMQRSHHVASSKRSIDTLDLEPDNQGNTQHSN